ncbi:MmgE/PrpD family protein [Brenneria goodwinii]|uniref:MmgE/PrpD family protein n=1 Tax=Brenneria goodwinii TaxID=1109412 RepID=UPI000EF22234|nr:MmgE/PrpD family protein [Brenneria goodwinii]MCG8158263.1 MmgE/PrpD family protein [Brenneria goodwinii]MCG8162351.1 MmgE/PrpD family protein [Brenneria goodwinii]MCG8167313.1 MmgE/PrpD family protein [Brenneria goodwinii]MCG8172019.1 MmgE/PrpD family protein [Brenneria goodwinii]MCG8175574.1 MmgE/PrpD family protein [Brenneria goodwinii]
MKSYLSLELEIAAGLQACFAADKPAELLRIAGEHLTDLIGVMLAGAQHPASLNLLSNLAKCSHAPGLTARAIGRGDCLGVQDAALFNAFAGHIHDYDDDDTLMSLSHPTVTVGAACLALGEAHNISGKSLVNAYIAGVETIAQLGVLVHPYHYMKGWHATCTLGVVGAAAASGLMMDLTLSQLRHAIGFAASMAAGLRSNFGSDAKPLQTALAASHGVMAARLAASGMTSTPGSLLGPMGWADVFAERFDVKKAAAMTFGRPYALLEPGITIKRYPCCTCSHAAVALLQDVLATEKPAVAHIAAIDVYLDPAAPNILIHERAATGLEAKFSLPYSLAIAALVGHLDLDDFSDANVQRQDVRALAAKVRTLPDDDLPRGIAGVALGCRLQVTTTSGESYRRATDVEPGSRTWRLSRRQLESKFCACARCGLPSAALPELFAELLQFERIENVQLLIDRLCSGNPLA